MRQYTGWVKVAGEDFWAWVQNRTKDFDTIYKAIDFDLTDLILTPVNSAENFYIPIEDFWGWVIENYMPNPADEVECSKPVWDKANHCLNIEFAAGSVHPSQWAVKPAWMMK